MRTFIIFVLLMILTRFMANAQINDEPAWVYKGRGDNFLREGEIGKAIFEYKKALVNRKLRVNGDTITVYPEVNIKLAKIYLFEGLFELALQQLEIAERFKDFLEIPDLIYDILYTRANLYVLQGRVNDATEVYEKIIARDKNWDYYSQLGLLDLPKSFVEDRELETKFGRAYFEVGEMKYVNKHFESATAYLKGAMAYQYKPEETRRYLVDSYINLENRVMAERVRNMYKKREARL